MKTYLLSIAIVLSFLQGEWIPESGWMAGESSLKKNLLESTGKLPDTPVYGSPLTFVFYQALKLYQNKIYQAPVNGSKPGRCPFYPSCSRFALQAIGAHGPVWGSLMMADRLIIREHQDLSRHYERIEVNGELRFADPVEINFIFRNRDSTKNLF